MIYNGKVDIIIPAYNVPDEMLIRCLSSIVCQDKKEIIEITIVDDASTKENYKNIIKMFEPILKINLLRLKENKGPGVARQYGLDNTKNEFIMFLDADDMLNGHFAVVCLLDALKYNPNKKIASGLANEIFTNSKEQTTFSPLGHNMVWVFGKLYRREMIELYNIKFHPTSRANEDAGFNAIYFMLIDCNENNMVQVNDFIYCWMYNKDSITRTNNSSYAYRSDSTGSFCGYVENMGYAINEARKKIKGSKQYVIDNFIIHCMMSLYSYYIECSELAPEYIEENVKYCKSFYNKFYKNIENKIQNDILCMEYHKAIGFDIESGKFTRYIPKVDYFTFLNILKKEE